MINELSVSDVARSLELFNLGMKLQEEAQEGRKKLQLVKEPFLRKRESVDNLVVAFGSYDPLSIAHESLFLKGLEVAGNNSELLIVTSTNHFDKEIDLARNSAIYDRIHALDGFASCQGNVSIALFNSPLYIDLARSIKEMYTKVNIHFVLATDVLPKVIDKAGYETRGMDADKTLEELFENNFIVSERRVDGNLVTLDDLKGSNSYLNFNSEKLKAISLDGKYARLKIPIKDVSSTLIRTKRIFGEDASNLVAVGISDFIDKRGLYLKNTMHYVAFTYARERFARENTGKPIATYIDKLMIHLNNLSLRKDLQEKEISMYAMSRSK